MFNFLRRKRAVKLRLKIDFLKRQVSPYHQVHSNLKFKRKDYQARIIQKEIEAIEKEIQCLDRRCRKLEGIK